MIHRRLLLILLFLLSTPLHLTAQEPEETPEPTPVPIRTSLWSEPVNISDTPNSSWFADLAVDSQENVHVVWCETTQLEEGGEKEQVFYTKWDGVQWSQPNDIVAPSFNIIRNAIAIDRADQLHMTYGHPTGGSLGLFYASAAANESWSAANWSTPRIVNVRGSSYATDLEVDSKGTLHLIFDDRGNQGTEKCPACADIFYRRSTNQGQTWDSPIVLSDTPTGSSRAQMQIDDNDIIHVTWDEGWDRLSGYGEPIYSMYTFSSDAGTTWADPVIVDAPVTSTVQLTAGSDNRGGVMLVWRTTSNQNIYYQWSADGGLNWTIPSSITTILARPWSTPFDSYDMTTDSEGQIHLVVVGSEPGIVEAPLEVLHIQWDGNQWSDPESVYGGAGLPEYPRIKVSQGNRLHAVWFVRDDMISRGNYEVWYSTRQTTAPLQLPAPTFTPQATPTPTPVHTPTPQATRLYGETLPADPPVGEINIQNLYTDSDDIVLLLIAISPLALIVAFIYIVRRGWLRR